MTGSPGLWFIGACKREEQRKNDSGNPESL